MGRIGTYPYRCLWCGSRFYAVPAVRRLGGKPWAARNESESVHAEWEAIKQGVQRAVRTGLAMTAVVAGISAAFYLLARAPTLMAGVR
jgi:hypothetical protein